MATSATPQNTDFSRDILGRYVCNGLDEALASANAHPFDIIVLGGGSFGPIFAQHLLYRDTTRARRILVLEAGRLPCRSMCRTCRCSGSTRRRRRMSTPACCATRFGDCPGGLMCRAAFPAWPTASAAARCSLAAGRRSCSPVSSAAAWPAAVPTDLNGPWRAVPRLFRPGGRPDRHGRDQRLHLRTAARGAARAAAPGDRCRQCDRRDPAGPAAADPDRRSSAARKICSSWKRRSPCRRAPPRAGFFPFNKFSSAPLIIEIARAAQGESGGDDSRKRLMVVPDCHVTRLITDGAGPIRRVVARRDQPRHRAGAGGSGCRDRAGHDRKRAAGALSLPGLSGRPADRRQSDGASAVQPDDPRAAGGDRRA